MNNDEVPGMARKLVQEAEALADAIECRADVLPEITTRPPGWSTVTLGSGAEDILNSAKRLYSIARQARNDPSQHGELRLQIAVVVGRLSEFAP